MCRMAITQLQAWKMKERRKPLIIRRARQVGKTWLMREFGASEYAFAERNGHMNDMNGKVSRIYVKKIE